MPLLYRYRKGSKAGPEEEGNLAGSVGIKSVKIYCKTQISSPPRGGRCKLENL